MTLMRTWRWIRYPRIAWEDHQRTKSWADQYHKRNTKWGRRPGFAADADVTVYWPDVRPCYDRPRDPKHLKGWKLWLYAIVALVLSTAIWWPADMVNVQPAWERSVQTPTERVLPLERPSRPPHPTCAYRIPGRC